MTERERLIELIKTMECRYEKTCPQYGEMADCAKCQYDDYDACNSYARKADYLLANGVIVPPCKVGDTVYVEYHGQAVKGGVMECSIHLINANTVTVCINKEISIYKEYYMDDVFLNKEQALKARERKLEAKERENKCQ